MRGGRLFADFACGMSAVRSCVWGSDGFFEGGAAGGATGVDEGARPLLAAIADVADRMVDQGSGYRCRRCGFGARNHHWQCPSCKGWDTLRPQHRMLAE